MDIPPVIPKRVDDIDENWDKNSMEENDHLQNHSNQIKQINDVEEYEKKKRVLTSTHGSMSFNSTQHIIENCLSDLDNFDLEHLRFQSGSINQSEGDEESNIDDVDNDAFSISDDDVYPRYDDSTDHRILRK